FRTWSLYLFMSPSSSLPRPPPCLTDFPYTTLFRSRRVPPDSRRPAATAPGTRRRTSHTPAAQIPCPWPPGRSRSPSPRSCPRPRSEEHTSELQSRENLVCRLLLEKKKMQEKANCT